jgi:hypothetical protein
MPNNVVGDLKTLNALRHAAMLSTHQILSSEPAIMLPNTPFIDAVATLIEWARKPYGAEIVESTFDQVGCCRDWPSAFIKFRDSDGVAAQQEYQQPPNPDQPGRIKLALWQGHRLDAPAAIGVDAYIPAVIICYLAHLLNGFDQGRNHLMEIQLPKSDTDKPGIS